MKVIKGKKFFRKESIAKAIDFYNNWRFSIRYKFTSITIMIVLIPLTLVGIYFYSSISSISKESANRYLLNYIENSNDSIESQFDIIDNTSMVFLSNPTLRTILENAQTQDQYQRTKNATEMDYTLKYLLFFNYAWDNKLIDSIFVFKDESTYYYILRDLEHSNQVEKNLNIFKQQANSKEEKHLISPSLNDPTVYFVCNVNNLNTLKYEGKLIFAINESKLSNIKQSAFNYKNAQTFTFDNQGIIFSHTEKDLLGQKVDDAFFKIKDSTAITEVVTNKGVYYAAAKKIKKYGLTSVVAVPKSEVLSNLSISMEHYLEIIVLFSIVLLIVGILISTRITKPLKHLMNNIKAVKNGRFDTKMPAYKYLELNQLSSVFNTMTDEINHLINEVYEKQLLLKESELQSLQSQVNPHFLFNVLETVSWEARMSGNDNIYKMVTSLGQLIRTSISISGSEKITIREELKYIEFYLELQKVRFGDRLNTQISVSDHSLLDCYLPKLCIQPIVENAIIHGLEEKRGKGNLNIQVWEDQNDVYICIKDDGIGFNSKDLNLGTSNHLSLRKKGHTSIGLFNTNKRIKLLYGESYGVDIRSKPGEGTTVMVNIPTDKEGLQNVQGNDCR